MKDRSIPVSEEIPSNVTLYYTDEEQNFIIDLFDLTADTDDTWILNFGIHLYNK